MPRGVRYDHREKNRCMQKARVQPRTGFSLTNFSYLFIQSDK